ncbi:MAG TPA: flagellar biosynthesis protein FlhF, partial [Thiotrichales bacterium]|nr:flagellar biosynthesis protein FlhF [Thiotrichales bacterium]
MNIKRFFAADMRQAIRKVRDELGPDAVILSNRKAGGGIEIVAAVDYDEAEVRRALAEREAAQAGGLEAGSPRGRAESPAGQQEPRQEAGAPASAEAAGRPAFRPEELWVEDPALAQVRREIHELRGLLEHQLAHLAWGEMSRSHPAQVELLRRLSALGLAPDVSRQLATAAAGEQDRERAWRRALAL